MYLGRVPAMGLDEIRNQTYEELKHHYTNLKAELKVARVNFEFERQPILRKKSILFLKNYQEKRKKRPVDD